MDKNILNDEIVEFLQKSSSPMTAESIAEVFGVAEYRVRRSLDELLCGGLIIQIHPKNKASGRTYYSASRKIIKTVDVETNTVGETDDAKEKVIENSIIQETVDIKDNYKDLSEKIEIIDKNVGGIYANIISIMSIFVAIFALIAVNTNIAFELTKQNMCDVFCGIIAINIFVVVCIIVLLVAVRLIIVNPLLGKKRKSKKE